MMAVLGGVQIYSLFHGRGQADDLPRKPLDHREPTTSTEAEGSSEHLQPASA
jgi:hypothetical protein